MANRYSPSVLPESAPRFDPETIVRALDMFQRDREHEAQRKAAEESRHRDREFEEARLQAFRRQQENDQVDRQRELDQQAAADYDRGFRPKGTSTLLEQEIGPPEVVGGRKAPQAGPMVGVDPAVEQRRQSPLAQRIQEARLRMQDPTATSMPTRVQRLPAAGASHRPVSELAAETAAYQPLPSGGFRDLRETPEQKELRRQQEEGERAARVGEGLGADETLREYFRINPDALGRYVDHTFNVSRDRARDAAALQRTQAAQSAATERARLTQDRIDARTPAGGAEAGGPNQLTLSQGYTQARQLVRGLDLPPTEEASLVQEVARALVVGQDVAWTMRQWASQNLMGDPLTEEFGYSGPSDASGPYLFPEIQAQPPRGRALAHGLEAEIQKIQSHPQRFTDEDKALAADFTDAELLEMGFTRAHVDELRALR